VSDTVPKLPGVYRFIDKNDKVLYVGKAKSLKNRVSSYFNQKDQMNKTRVMLKHARRIEFTVVETENDAYLLENSLIKKYQPRYNVDLKDGKSYTYLSIKNEAFPRIFFTRKLIKDGSQYFGPYTSKWRTKILLDLIKDLFPLRTCSLDLSEEKIAQGKYKVCLEYHIQNCNGPCVGLEKAEEYEERIDQIVNILKGNFKPVKEHLLQHMDQASVELDFEKAQKWKNKLIAFENYQSKSMVSNPKIKDLDVFTIKSLDKYAFVQYLKIINGAIINTHTTEVRKKLDESDREILTFVFPRIRERFGSHAPTVLSSVRFQADDDQIKVVVPKIGDKKRLIDLSEKNLLYYIMSWKKDKINEQKKDKHEERILKTLQHDLRMKEIPFHIECFDNSNIQGTHPVASCVVFKNARSAKKDYRHFNIKTVQGANDFASMEEVVQRRYSRLIREGQPLPQLVVIDGGKGQLSSAVLALKRLGIDQDLTIIGIAKKLEEIYFPGDSIPLYINKKSESLKLIQLIRNEAHRFAITFHRTKRSQNFTHSDLTKIPGIGVKTAEKLIKSFRSVKRIKKASQEDLMAVVGPKNASRIIHHFAEEATN